MYNSMNILHKYTNIHFVQIVYVESSKNGHNSSDIILRKKID